jgi:5-oxopent-3-ene-1,2,5-tricarboxylate decarboxylase/2-hydroxyhepta-2,4-diene-1,7-dioate isomerase
MLAKQAAGPSGDVGDAVAGRLAAPPVAVPMAPYRLSGTVLGVLMNHRPALAALGDAVYRPPYKAPPEAPVLYVKPRNTWVASGGAVPVPADAPELELGAALGAVIGRPANQIAAADALDHIAGWLLLADLCVPHASLYRPSLRWRARDGFCPLGPYAVPRAALEAPDALTLTVEVDGVPVHAATTGDRVRGVATLIADVSEFMTLQPGDVLMLGVAHGAPRVRAGQRARITAPGLAPLTMRFVAEAAQR